jgi:antitoxin HicB
MEKPIDYYMNLPYTIELRQDPEEGWFVRVKELRGCMSEGDTAEEAVAMIREAMQLWLEVALEEGIPIPEPRPEEDYSGKFVVRMPRSLHRELVEKANQEGTSLNQTINVALARAVGRPVSEGPAPVEQPGWPGLKPAVRHALQAAGLSEEAGELDERLFANHMEQLIAQVESAIQAGYFRDALWALETVIHTLRPAAHMSPVLGAFLRTVALLSDQVETVARVQKGVMEEVILRSRISDLVQRSAVAGDVTRSISVEYSKASTELPREETAGQLFSRPVSVSRW